ncbi:Bacterial type II/III secretion system short domain protein [Rubripirellula tenax]|uniref:Bacterial type II/III secretion system short domain protein n=1 Tax=Rubripirellula tenax TaxID=2528015 RepID=A0A5C6END6_9BACT|nr:secretin N-terminal domain-containing protein [Rubripirellula tenax]TWU48859.1 Bacterial type II/III secretion system short domain protein [Rubripirellula tenax]
MKRNTQFGRRNCSTAFLVGATFVGTLVCTSGLEADDGIDSVEPLVVASPEPSDAVDVSAGILPLEMEPPTDLRFSFNGTPWREVIRWIADESGLALHVGDLPPGSFTYSDVSSYDTAAAIDRINLFLLAEGFTLVRSGDLLSVINLGDPRSLQQLDLLAAQIPTDALADAVNQHEVVKCIFALGNIDSDDAVAELAALKLMTQPTILSKTNQLMITDTVSKLRNVRDVLAAFEPNEMENGTVVKTFSLQHVSAEDILLVARPHLGLATGEMIGIDVSLSSDIQGKHLFATGVEDKVKVIERLVEALDQPEPVASTIDGEKTLQSHLVSGGNVETVYNVLQTLLNGKEVRLSIDERSSSIVALAPLSVQNEIAATIQQVQASEAAFEVIPLQNTDPFFVITLLEQMLDLPGPLTSPKNVDPDAPKIDADPGNRRLFVRGKQHQIDQIKKIVEGLEATSGTSQSSLNSESADQVRIVPIKGQRAIELLETAATFWRSTNPVVIFPSSNAGFPAPTERVPNASEPDRAPLPSADPASEANESSSRGLSDRFTAIGNHDARQFTAVSNRVPTVRCQVTDRGILIQSEDTDALSQFESHLRMIAGPDHPASTAPVVFYLQHTRPSDALRLLGELIDGGQSAREGEAGTLVNGYVSGGPSSSFFGSLISSQEGTTTMMAGSITVVADSRLNRLIAQGTEDDIETIAGYLRIIDKDESITDIQIHGRSHVIELLHTSATEVAKSIKEAFVDRVAEKAPASRSGSSSLKGEAALDPREAYLAARAASLGAASDSKKSNEQDKPAVADVEPKMTIAVHESSNSLIVTAPDALFAEVESLVQKLDVGSEQTVEVVTPINNEVYGLLLQELASGSAASGPIRSAAKPKTTSRAKTTSRTSARTK